MSIQIRSVALLLSVLMLTACAVANTGGSGAKAPAAETGLFGRKHAELNVETEKAFKGHNQVIIGSFKVGFLEETKTSAKAGGGLLGNGFGGKSLALVSLAGVGSAEMQAITDAAYADFLTQLQTQGYTVLDRNQLLSHAKFAKANADDAPIEIKSDAGKMLYFVPTELGNKAYFYMQDGIRSKGGFGFGNPSVATSVFADETGIRVLAVNYIIDFATAESYGAKHTSTSSVNVYQGISVKPGSQVALIGGSQGTFSTVNGSVSLGQPIYSTEKFGELTDVTSTAFKTTQVVTNVVSALGGLGTNKTSKYEVQADPAKYSSVTGGVLAKTNLAITEQMASVR